MKAQKARLVLSGDTRQHSSVGRGDALRLVIQSELVEVKATEQVHRQQPERYRRAVEELSQGSISNGFQILESLGAIREEPDLAKRLGAIVNDTWTVRGNSPTCSWFHQRTRKVISSRGRSVRG